MVFSCVNETLHKIVKEYVLFSIEKNESGQPNNIGSQVCVLIHIWGIEYWYYR